MNIPQTGFQRGAGGATLDRRYQLRATPLVSASLPGVGTRDGDVISFKAAAATLTNAVVNTVWTFRYDATDAYWYPQGCAPIFQQVATAQSTASATYVALATVGPSLTVPLAGDYLIEQGAGITTAAASAGAMSYDIGGTGAVDADEVVFTQVAASAQLASVARATSHLNLAALTAIVSKYRSIGGTSVTFEKRWLKITPLRVH